MLIDFDRMMKKHEVQAKGVLHLGASEGQEAPAYHRHGLKMAFVEALPAVFEILKLKTEQYGAVCYNACVSNVNGQLVVFNVANNGGQSSSMLEFGTHLTAHPDVQFVDKISMKTVRADALVKNVADYDMLVMDLQGVELMALQGLGEKLHGFKYVYTEVNQKQVYKGCVEVKELDNYLRQFGFQRIETKWTSWGWGDALYAKPKKEMPNRVFKTESTGIDIAPKMPIVYPPNNFNDFEHWFKDNYKETGTEEREYLPVMWTAYQLKHGKNRLKHIDLQGYINQLDVSKKYFTVVQHDDGIPVELRRLDIKVFSMGGGRIDYPLPLLCEPQPYKFDVEKDIFAFFMGAKTHNVRRFIKEYPGFVVRLKHEPIEEYCRLMARSTFALCPRGYGITSFRIQEALQFGAIPVYISDRFIFPHNLDFEDFGVVIKEKDVRNLNSILMRIPQEEIERKQKLLPDIFEKYFTYESNLQLIKDNL
jgi:FkbM family methyltransferase